MDSIVIEGVRPYDGRYEFDINQRPLTTREWGWIKRLAGYLPLNIEEGFSDPELITVFAAIALCRAGRVQVVDVPDVFNRLADAEFGSAVRLELEEKEEEEDAGPPERSSNSNDATSGLGSTTSSATLHPILTRSGAQQSGTSESDQETSAA